MPGDNIRFTQDPSSELSQFLSDAGYSRVVVLADEHTKALCYPRIEAGLPPHDVIVIPPGEEQKNINTCVTIWDRMTALQLDRHAVAIVLGGGVLGDMGGFCAATYKRGIDFILVPTTLLSIVDASIGGKLGIDFNDFKNHIGVFQKPVLTLLHSGFLATLPESELRSGYAEVIKHTLISDRNMWDVISKRSLREQDWEELIRHSVAFKARVTEEDPREKGLRKVLNAGHTIGHALESHFLSEARRVLHGEAIAVGLVAEGWLAWKRNMLTEGELQSIMGHIRSVFGKIELTGDQIERISTLARQDKKNRGNKILCVLLKGIGSAVWDVEISVDDVNDALSFYEAQM
ncbi:MAG: 3-dehydroquinate synthase [Bacteroidota bacterium]|jgi:3-dehydroquinate synthase|nr:MAG: 3-dehydroquinate synthase [Bacteroidota bacterium]